MKIAEVKAIVRRADLCLDIMFEHDSATSIRRALRDYYHNYWCPGTEEQMHEELNKRGLTCLKNKSLRKTSRNSYRGGSELEGVNE